jgi:hypothetical protein
MRLTTSHAFREDLYELIVEDHEHNRASCASLLLREIGAHESYSILVHVNVESA